MTHTCPCGMPLEWEDEIQTGRCRACRQTEELFTEYVPEFPWRARRH